MSNLKVIVTRRWPREVEERLVAEYGATLNEDDHPFSGAEMRDAIKSYDAVLPTVCDKLPASLFASDDVRAKLLGNFGVGYNHIDVEAATRAGLAVTNTPGCLTDCTADIAMALLLAVARRAGEGERQLRAGQWSGWCPTHLQGAKVSGKTLGIIGMGRIGKAMARRCHFGFDMNVVFYNRSKIDPVEAEGVGATQLESIDAVLETADFVSLHCPGGGENTGLINAERLSSMKESAFLINTARGDVVDEAALIEALHDGVIAGAGLDVYRNEPSVHPGLLELENVVLLPHLGSATTETRVAMGMKVLENLDAFASGNELPNRVN